MVCTGEDCPVTIPPKLSEVAERLSVGGAQPKPLNATVCLLAPSVNVSVPVATPRWVGAKANIIWQSAPGASVPAPHPLVAIVKGEVMAMLVMEIDAVPLLPACTCCEPEAAPTSTGGNWELWPGEASKLRVDGDSVTNPAGVPVPLNSTVGSCPP